MLCVIQCMYVPVIICGYHFPHCIRQCATAVGGFHRHFNYVVKSKSPGTPVSIATTCKYHRWPDTLRFKWMQSEAHRDPRVRGAASAGEWHCRSEWCLKRRPARAPRGAAHQLDRQSVRGAKNGEGDKDGKENWRQCTRKDKSKKRRLTQRQRIVAAGGGGDVKK